ncbi:fasciclin domain-containing protein [Mangrovimonas aestuarii]|uniref:fasciclin domain-containing protein n=1 Tax=Mangrovimonas aestuarii TaxID=3018443 RepID=UPI00237827D6|nr:fasciclin domain-containing protein [Mangrovimonas aestuarii]
MKNLLYLLSAFCLSLFVVACSDDDDGNNDIFEPTQDIVEIAQDTPELSSLVDALIQADAGLVDVLSGEGPYTVFAPDNQAFQDLLDILGDDYNSISDFDTADEKALLAEVLTYHVVMAEAYSSDLSDGQNLTTVQGENISIVLDNGVYIDDATDMFAKVTEANIEATNGVIHIVDKVLLPQSVLDALTLPNIVEIALDNEDLSSLVAALQQADAGLVEVLSGEGPFTVFAPTNQAFQNILDALGDDYNSISDFDTADEKALLTEILTYHVVPNAAAYSGDLSNGQTIETAQGESIGINLDGGVFIDDATDSNAQVTNADIMASNGVIHIVDKVLLPQAVLDALALPNIVELALANENLSSLVAALQQADAGLVDLLSGEGPFTVFAPTNDAFQDLLDELGNDYNSIEDFDTAEEKALLANILQYHVVTAAAYSTDLSNGQTITAAQGGTLTVDLSSGVAIVDEQGGNSNVIAADIEASNGVVHVIDRVLLPN